MRGNSVYKKLFVALLALPNLAAAFSSTSLLFLPGALWNQNERLVSNMGQVVPPSPSLPSSTILKYRKRFAESFWWEGCNSHNMGRNLHVDDELRSAESVYGVYDWCEHDADE
jgi:hypothetical protein